VCLLLWGSRSRPLINYTVSLELSRTYPTSSIPPHRRVRMQSLVMVLTFVALTFICWGNYGPLMHEGQHEMGNNSLLAFTGVGMAYFLIAVVVPVIVLRTRGEKGKWTISGTAWSLSAGVAGALGALGIIMAFKNHGKPVYVMPLVFGCAPVVNTFVTMLMSRTWKEAGFVFYLGVVIVALGAAGVMRYKPVKTRVSYEKLESGLVRMEKQGIGEATGTFVEATREDIETKKEYASWRKSLPASPSEFSIVLMSIALTALCWGAYGPVLHRGQSKMAGSRLRPFLCVGLAYFLIAVIVPIAILVSTGGGLNWTVSGTLWSMGAGAAGAIGALGIILAFNFGGKPIFVMPLIFGCAPVVNTFTTMLIEKTLAHMPPAFMGSLGLVIVGAVTVLIFSPKSGPKPQPAAS
jgi:hypothetical protein